MTSPSPIPQFVTTPDKLSIPISPLPSAQPSPEIGSITRTVAIIKNHALNNRFDIEHRIEEAAFEIVKERQMEFDTETDPDTLDDLFGDDAASFNEGPVWVYVLERRRAVEVWKTLMGDADPAIARGNAPKSLRALYGTDLVHNAVMGSSDSETAEIQIASLFVSSPPFPISELPDESHFDAMYSIGSSELSVARQVASDEGYAPSIGTSPSAKESGKSRRTSVTGNGKMSFKARPLPVTHAAPDIVPRTTRAAALRAGVAVPTKSGAPRVIPTKQQQTATFMDVPGHKRSGTISVASTAPPVIAPRMTRAASLRIGKSVVPSPAPIKTAKSDSPTAPSQSTFEGVPGHKRRESISVASTRAPTIAPRLNKSAALRVAVKESGPPPSSFSLRPPPTMARSNSAQSLYTRPVSATQKEPSNGTAQRRASAPIRRASSVSRATGPLLSRELPPTSAKPPPSSATTPVKPRLSVVSAAPSIAPRMNKSAQLRAAKKEEEAKAAAAAQAKLEARKAGRRSMMI